MEKDLIINQLKLNNGLTAEQAEKAYRSNNYRQTKKDGYKLKKKFTGNDQRFISAFNYSVDQWDSFITENGFRPVNTFAQWKKLGYRIIAGQHGEKIDINVGHQRFKTYTYFSFEQVKKDCYTLETIPATLWDDLSIEQKMELLPF